MYKEITNIDKCTGCMACVDSCHKNAITISNIGGILFPQIDTSKCVNCNACKKVCPSINTTKQTDLKNTQVYAAWSTDDKIRLNAASGGFCTQMGINTINHGGYVATVIMKDNCPEYILTNDIEELLKSSNSKYVQGNPSGIYRKVRDVLRNGNEVLFCGLPCYCAALKNFLKKEYANLTTVDLICSAPPSRYAIDVTLEHCKASTLHMFRKKIDGGMWGGGDHNIVVDNDRIIEQKRTVFYNIFASMMTARKACLDCQFAKLERISDFTVGDFHGFQCEGKEKGVCLVIANNPLAIEKLSKAEGLHTNIESWERAINSNPRLYNGYDFIRWHPVIVFRKYLYNKICFIKFCLNKGIFRCIWFPFKAITKIVIKVKYYNAIQIARKLK